MKLTPYLQFDGDCEQAFAFYAQLLGGEVAVMMRYSEVLDVPDMPALDKSEHDKIIHAELHTDTQVLMGSDMITSFGAYQKPQGIALTLSAADFAEGERVFNTLAQGGEVTMPFAPTFFSAGFGQVIDRFGIPWKVDISGAAQR